jgi:hypothetical protein
MVVGPLSGTNGRLAWANSTFKAKDRAFTRKGGWNLCRAMHSEFVLATAL